MEITKEKIDATIKLTGYKYNKITKEFWRSGFAWNKRSYFYIAIRNGALISYAKVLGTITYNEIPLEWLKPLYEIWGS